MTAEIQIKGKGTTVYSTDVNCVVTWDNTNVLLGSIGGPGSFAQKNMQVVSTFSNCVNFTAPTHCTSTTGTVFSYELQRSSRGSNEHSEN